MQITHVRVSLGDDLAVEFEHDAKHAVRGGMRRPHVQDHLLALHVAQFLNRIACAYGGIAKFSYLNGGHENYTSGVRTRGSRSMASLPPGTVTNGPPSSGAVLVKVTSGTTVGLPASGKSFRNGKYG